MDNLEIVVGTYEEYLLGFQCGPKNDDLFKSFASHCHSASVRAVASSGHYVASGGADDKVFIFDMLKRQELSLLNQQRGTVTSMAFTPDTSHLFVGDSSGALIAYSTATWEIHKIWPKAHKGNGVSLVKIHPSGKLAITLGTELNMQLWNLIRGTCVNTTNLKSVAELGKIVDCIEWNSSGDLMAISGAKCVQIWSTHTAVCERSFTVPQQPTCLAWVSEKVLAIGMVSGEILFRKFVKDGEKDAPENESKEQKLHEKRVKGMSLQKPYLASISSDGEVALSILRFEDEFGRMEKLRKCNVGCRPTCIALLDRAPYSNLKKEDGHEGEDAGHTSDEDDDEQDSDEITVRSKKGNGKLTQRTVEIEEEDSESDSDSCVTKPKGKQPGMFVLATPKTTPSKNNKRKEAEPSNSKKNGRAKNRKLN